ncbi:MAG: dienelactone hydrolase family protein [Pseudomonadota bacterium]
MTLSANAWGAHDPAQLIVLFHGYGSSGEDLLSLAPDLAIKLPDALFIAPDAPYKIPDQPMGYQWFDLQDRSLEAIKQNIDQARAPTHEWLDSLQKTYPNCPLGVLGFSQGGAVALDIGLARSCAAVVALSSFYVEIPTPHAHPAPVWMGHGNQDDVVAPQALPLSLAALNKAGISADGKHYPGVAHHTSPEMISDARDFLSKHLIAIGSLQAEKEV